MNMDKPNTPNDTNPENLFVKRQREIGEELGWDKKTDATNEPPKTEVEKENNFVKRQREIREELKDKSLWPKTNE